MTRTFPHEPHRWHLPDTTPEELNIRFKPGFHHTHEDVQAAMLRHGASYNGVVGDFAHQLSVDPSHSEKLARYLSESGFVEYAQPGVKAYQAYTPNVSNFKDQSTPHAIDCEGAWNITQGSNSVIVAVCDADGVDSTITQLANKLVLPGLNTAGGTNTSLNTGGTVNSHSHQTSGMGFVGADTDTGVAFSMAGIGFNTKILPVKMATLNDTNMAIALDLVRNNGSPLASICNFSMSTINGAAFGQVAIDAVNNAWTAGIVIVASAGNSSTTTPQYPGAMSNVLCVANVGPNGRKDSGSNYGSWVDIGAPGQDFTILADGTFLAGSADAPGSFPHLVNGTSFSAPVVSGVLALMLAANPNISGPELVRLITDPNNCKPTIAGPGGGGTDFSWPPQPAVMVNALKAVSAAIAVPPLTRKVPKGNVLIHGSY